MPLNVLLVCPKYPPSYWGFHYALGMVGKSAAMPPLGLITIAAMFPREDRLRLMDLNVEPLRDADLAWADVVMTSTMLVQRESLHEVILRCNRAGVPVVCGGPHPTTYHEEIDARFAAGGGVDHYVLGEAEDVFGDFLEAFRQGRAPRVIRACERPDVARAPVPRFDLLKLRRYGSMAVQFSRGCPFNCEFCDITKLYGRLPRTKRPAQFLAELDALHALGWRGPVFVVDDNFVGHPRAAGELLDAVTEWQARLGFPFAFYTEASVNVAQIPRMLERLAGAGFVQLFLGIETPNDAALHKTVKDQNTKRTMDARTHLLGVVRRIQAAGIEVSGGFIIGLDGDRAFDRHVDFVQEAGIPLAMTGLLGALKGTDLWDRLEREGRLLGDSTGNNTDGVLNFVPELPADQLISEYRRVVTALYEPTLQRYFERCWTSFENSAPNPHPPRRLGVEGLLALSRSLLRQIPSRQGPAYARFLVRVLSRKPRRFAEAVRLAIMGYHFQRVTRWTEVAHDFRELVRAELHQLREAFARSVDAHAVRREELAHLVRLAHEALARLHARHARLDEDLRAAASDALEGFRAAIDDQLARLRGVRAIQ